MLAFIAFTTMTIMGVYICYSINQLNKDIKYVRLGLDELESAVKDRHWVVYEGYKQVPQVYTKVYACACG